VNKDSQKPKCCLISCSVLKEEVQQLQLQKDLDVDVIFVSKNFHVDYGLLEKNLRKTIQRVQQTVAEDPILVYGELCLGPNGEMKQLAEEYGLVKVDAQNCVDCLLGGHGKIEEADPNHELMFFDPGMIGFFRDAQKKLKQQGMTEEQMSNLFSGIKGIVLLDTLGNTEKCKNDIENLNTGLTILETKNVGLANLCQVISEAIHRNRQKSSKTSKKSSALI
jgi:hypothetical protein